MINAADNSILALTCFLTSNVSSEDAIASSNVAIKKLRETYPEKMDASDSEIAQANRKLVEVQLKKMQLRLAHFQENDMKLERLKRKEVAQGLSVQAKEVTVFGITTSDGIFTQL